MFGARTLVGLRAWVHTEVQTRGAKYARTLKPLPGFKLPFQANKGAILKTMEKARLRRKRLSTPNPYPKKPMYGYDRSLAGKLPL